MSDKKRKLLVIQIEQDWKGRAYDLLGTGEVAEADVVIAARPDGSGTVLKNRYGPEVEVEVAAGELATFIQGAVIEPARHRGLKMTRESIADLQRAFVGPIDAGMEAFIGERHGRQLVEDWSAMRTALDIALIALEAGPGEATARAGAICAIGALLDPDGAEGQGS